MNIRRFQKIAEPGTVNVGYVHGGGTIYVLITLKTEASAEEVAVLGKDVAMQVASMNPKYVGEDDVDPEFIESEKKILIQQALNEGKPADIVEKMVVGRLKKELKGNLPPRTEVCQGQRRDGCSVCSKLCEGNRQGCRSRRYGSLRSRRRHRKERRRFQQK